MTNKSKIAAYLLLFLGATNSFGQSTPALTLEQAVAQAVARYPSVRVSQEQIAAAAAGIQLARTAYLPKVDAMAGVNRATRNNIFGLLLPSQVMAPISGPVLGTNDLANVWGSTAGFLASWEPFDFGLRQANVAVAQAARTRAEAGLARTQFELSTITADTFLTLLAAQETVRAAQAGVDRAEILIKTVDALVRSELRPGAELSRARAEEAAARTQLIRAEQAVAETKAVLAQLLGIEPAQVAALPGNLLSPPSDSDVPAEQLANNPIAQEQNAAVAEANARLKAIERSFYPRFYLQGAAYARGSGALPNGVTLGGLERTWSHGPKLGYRFYRDVSALRISRDSRSRKYSERQHASGTQPLRFSAY